MKELSPPGPKALALLQLLIPLITWSVVNVNDTNVSALFLQTLVWSHGRSFMTRSLSWCQPHAWDAVSNSSKYYIPAGTQLKVVQIMECDC